jgi:hypothetical protein
LKKNREISYIECDGCGYALTHMGIVDEMAAMGDARIIELRIPWKFDGSDRGVLEFHFHAPRPTNSGNAANDCLRYFILNPSIVKSALANRDFPDEEVEAFLAQVSYRQKVA